MELGALYADPGFNESNSALWALSPWRANRAVSLVDYCLHKQQNLKMLQQSYDLFNKQLFFWQIALITLSVVRNGAPDQKLPTVQTCASSCQLGVICSTRPWNSRVGSVPSPLKRALTRLAHAGPRISGHRAYLTLSQRCAGKYLTTNSFGGVGWGPWFVLEDFHGVNTTRVADFSSQHDVTERRAGGDFSRARQAGWTVFSDPFLYEIRLFSENN